MRGGLDDAIRRWWRPDRSNTLVVRRSAFVVSNEVL